MRQALWRYNSAVAEPLDYRNANAPDFSPGQRGRAPRVAIPVEFEVAVTRTDDHAAARAIEDEFVRQGVGVFRAEEGAAGVQFVLLYVRVADRERAGAIAASIFLRRRRIKSLPRQDVPRGQWVGEDGEGVR